MPESGAKKNLLDAAEKLVAEKGFDLVSVRDVTGAVKANVAAVNYHFGSREGLMDLVTLRMLEPLNEERLKALDCAESARAAKMATTENILSAFVKPLLSTAARLAMDTGFFLTLTGRILVLPDERMLPSLVQERAAVTDRYLAAIARALPKTSAQEIAASWKIFESGLGQALLNLTPGEDAEQMLTHWTAFAVRGFASSSSASVSENDDGQGMLFGF